MGGIVNKIGDVAGGALKGAVLGPLGASIGGFIGGGGSDYLLGNNIPSELKNPQLTSFTSPGLNATFLSPTNLNVEQTPYMKNLWVEYQTHTIRKQTS